MSDPEHIYLNPTGNTSYGDVVKVDGTGYIKTEWYTGTRTHYLSAFKTYSICNTGECCIEDVEELQPQAATTEHVDSTDKVYLNPNDNVIAGTPVMFQGRCYTKTGQTGTMTHLLTAVDTSDLVISEDSIGGEDDESDNESGEVTPESIYTDDIIFTHGCGTSSVMTNSKFSDGKAKLFYNQQLGCKVTLVVPDIPVGNYHVNLITLTTSSQGLWRLNQTGVQNQHYADTTNGTTSSNWQVSMPYTQESEPMTLLVHTTPGDLELEFELVGYNTNVTDTNNLQLIVDKLVLYS